MSLAKLKKMVKQLESLKGRHTELISVYIPQGYKIEEITNLISNEISLTQNVKSKTVRKNVTGALTKIQQHLKLYKKTPKNGLAIFCGNVSEKEGVADIKIWAVEPPEPVKIKLYWCDQTFKLDALKAMLEEKEVYGIVVMDNSEATIGLLKGKAIQVKRHFESIVPSKTGKGGQSAQRFERVRAGLIHDFYKKIAEQIHKNIPKGVKGIVMGGPGPAKENFLRDELLHSDYKKLILGPISTSGADESGLHELVQRASDLLAEASVMKEKKLMQKFFEELQKDSGLVTYGINPTVKALQAGAVEIILVSDELELEELEVECSQGHAYKKFGNPDDKHLCKECGQKMSIIGEMDIIDAFEDLAKQYKTEVIIVSRDTREGEQLYELGGIGAILRWRL
jgi:peptide chain release factor subunit 1